MAHALGYRFRLHRKDLPGSPDLTFPGKKAVVFVHGCFWHRHQGCKKATTPKSREGFWAEKFDRNVRRDGENVDKLARLGWRVLVIWECETKDRASLQSTIRAFLGT
jgi:DNA mismatch endonuclease (patch repair protein)